MTFFYALADDGDGAVVGGSPLFAERAYEPPPVEGEWVAVVVARVVGQLEGPEHVTANDDRGLPVRTHAATLPVVGRPLPWVDTGGRRHAHLNRQQREQQRWRYVTVEHLEQYMARPRALRTPPPAPTSPVTCLAKLRRLPPARPPAPAPPCDRAQAECIERLRHRYVRVTLGRSTEEAVVSAPEPMRLPRPLLSSALGSAIAPAVRTGLRSQMRTRSYPDAAGAAGAEAAPVEPALLRQAIALPWARLHRAVHTHVRMSATLAERAATETIVRAARDDLVQVEAVIARAMAGEGLFNDTDPDTSPDNGADDDDDTDTDTDTDDYGYARPRPFPQPASRLSI